eukprot:scaffold7332_cov133-Isochrysis_galbana.AAC.1
MSDERTPELVLRCSTTCYNLEACVVLNGLRPTRRPQWHNGSLTALGGMCLAMWRSKHPTMTIRPELTVTPYQATSDLPPATGPPRSRRPASAGNFVFALGLHSGAVKALDD